MTVSPAAVLAMAALGAATLAGRHGGSRPGGRAPTGGRYGSRHASSGHGANQAARWATRRDLRGLVVPAPAGGRVTLGRAGRHLVAADAGHSVLVVGPTQSHKTSGLAVPAILEWRGPVVAASVKADLARHTQARRRRCGQVWVYDPVGVAGGLVDGGARPARWSPVDPATSWAGARQAATDLVDTARLAGGPMADGDFWYASAAKLLGPLLHAAALGGGGMGDVVRWLDLQDEGEPADALEQAGAHAALRAVQACWGRDARQRSAVYATAESVVQAFADPVVLDAADGPGERLAPGRLIESSDTLYLCAPAHHQRRLRPVFAALLSQVLGAAVDVAERRGAPLDPRLLVVVDEAANVAPVADLDVIAATASGHGVQLVTVWQDLAQVESRYGSRAGTVVNNHRAKLFLSGIADPATLERASALAGTTQRPRRTTTVDHQGHGTVADAAVAEPLLPPDALRRLTPGFGVLLCGHHQPCRLRLRPWFADRRLRSLAAGDPVPTGGRGSPDRRRRAWRRSKRLAEPNGQREPDAATAVRRGRA